MRFVKILAVRNLLYAVTTRGELLLRGFHDNWERIDTGDLRVSDVAVVMHDPEDTLSYEIYIMTDWGYMFVRQGSYGSTWTAVE